MRAGNAIVPSDSANLLLLAEILNSSLLDAIKRESGTPLFRGGWLNCEIRFIRDLPIKLPETAGERKLAERIEESVRQVMAAKKQLGETGLSDREPRTARADR